MFWFFLIPGHRRLITTSNNEPVSCLTQLWHDSRGILLCDLQTPNQTAIINFETADKEEEISPLGVLFFKAQGTYSHFNKQVLYTNTHARTHTHRHPIHKDNTKTLFERFRWWQICPFKSCENLQLSTYDFKHYSVIVSFSSLYFRFLNRCHKGIKNIPKVGQSWVEINIALDSIMCWIIFHFILYILIMGVHKKIDIEN